MEAPNSWERGRTNGTSNSSSSHPELQVIILGSGGGPLESNTTAFLVRSTSTNWERGSLLAVDAGVHLSSINKILSNHAPYYKPLDSGAAAFRQTNDTDNIADRSAPALTIEEGPFKGMKLPFQAQEANAGWITRNLVDTFLITHPHLDHISGFVVNTAGLGGSRPKRLAGLPGTIEAFKTHIFNNVIWPNLSDENNGAGLVTYTRLVEGGSLVMGDGQGRGYVEVAEGLSVKTWSVSHGHCIEQNHVHTGTPRRSSSPNSFDNLPPSRQKSFSQSQSAMRTPTLQQQQSFRRASVSPFQSRKPSIALSDHTHRSDSFGQSLSRPPFCVYDSSAYFIRSQSSNHEVLIFGDVEPDSISLSPRNRQVWLDAAPKIARGLLRGIFIECSYSDEQPEETLFGHLKPYFLIEELKVLAGEVHASKRRDSEAEKEKEASGKKRKRDGSGNNGDLSQISPTSESARKISHTASASFEGMMPSPSALVTNTQPNVEIQDITTTSSTRPLQGVKIVVIHVKDRLDDEGPAGERILRELNEYEEEAKLGCEFIIAKKGESVFL